MSEKEDSAKVMEETSCVGEETPSSSVIGTKRPADEDNSAGDKKLKLSRQRIYKANSRYWKQVCKKLNKWTSVTSPHEPSFAMLYLMRSRGRVQVVWEGPQHMRDFATNNLVVDAFKEVALKQSILPVKTSKLQASPKLRLHSRDVNSYRSDQLSKLIAEILNPGCKKNFYCEENKPQWYPSHVPFKAPNHKTKDGEPKLNVKENREILEAFFIHCPEKFIIEGENELEEVEPIASCEESSDTESDIMPELVSVTPVQALNMLHNCKDWTSLQATAHKIKMAVDMHCLDNVRSHNLKEMSDRFLDMITPAPNGYQALVSTGDGNCFYNSMSILLSGSEDLAPHLRLASVLHAVQHFDHYRSMLEREMPEADVAVQFLCTVAGCNEDVEERPKNNPTATQIHTHTLNTSIKDSARIGRDAGFLQLLFLAGAVGHPIQQHCSLTGHDLYKTMVPPCSCATKYNSVVHIMWTNVSRGIPNHIVPLLKKHPTDDGSIDFTNKFKISNVSELGETCLMWGKCSSSLEALAGKKLHWVVCQNCQAWYHTVCVGFSPKLTNNKDFNFVCCKLPSPEENVIVVKHPLPVKRGALQSQLRVSDIHSVYPWNGLSDAIIDLYIREMLPPQTNAVCVGALTYTAIVKVFESRDSGDERLIQAHRSVNGKIDLNKDLIIFPCRTSGAWHWILVAVAPAMKKAFIMDSMSNALSPSSNLTVKRVNKFLVALGIIQDTLTPLHVKVYQQTNSTNCGVHVIYNMTQLVLHSFDGLKALDEQFSCMVLRRNILGKCHDLTGKLGRQYSMNRVEAHKQSILKKMTNSIDHGLKEVLTEDKGRGVIADCSFQKGDFLCCYKGELVSKTEGERRMAQFKEELGSFIFFFKHDGNDLCIDATQEDGSLGRLVNHSRFSPNVKVKIVASDTRPYLCMFASMDIKRGEELLYDYGERSQATIQNFAWLKK